VLQNNICLITSCWYNLCKCKFFYRCLITWLHSGYSLR